MIGKFAILAISALFVVSMVSPALSQTKEEWLKYGQSEVGFSHAYTQYQICNPLASDFAVSSKSPDSFDWTFSAMKGTLKSYWFEAYRPVTYTVPIESKTTCLKMTLPNGTNYEYDCIETPQTRTVSGYSWQRFDPVDGKYTMKPGSCEDIRLYGEYYPDSMGQVLIDNVLTVAGNVFSEYAWWSASYGFRYFINQTELIDRAFAVNDTVGVKGNIIWTFAHNDSYVYATADDFGAPIAIANETDEKFWEFEKNGTGNYPKGVWYRYGIVLHMNNDTFSDATSNTTWTDATTTGGSVVGGVFGNGLYLDDTTNDEIHTADTGAGGVIDVGGTFTISAWVYPTDTSDYDFVYSRQSGSTGVCSYGLIWNVVANKFSICTGSGATDSTTSADTTSELFRWYHVVFTADGTNRCIWINGTNRGCQAIGFTPADLTKSLFLGKIEYSDPKSFNGTIDEFRLMKGYNASETDIAKWYANGVNTYSYLGTSETTTSVTTSTTTTSTTSTTSSTTTTTPFANTTSCCPFDLTDMMAKSCEDNSTELATITFNNQTFQAKRTCTYGCDAISGCKPAPFYTDMYSLGFIIGIIIVFAFIMWVIRKI